LAAKMISVASADHTVRNFLKCHGLHRARRPKGLDFNMAVGEEFNLVVRAWASESDGVADALEVKLDSAVLQTRDELKQAIVRVRSPCTYLRGCQVYQCRPVTCGMY
jgi:hypothetical protein